MLIIKAIRNRIAARSVAATATTTTAVTTATATAMAKKTTVGKVVGLSKKAVTGIVSVSKSLFGLGLKLALWGTALSVVLTVGRKGLLFIKSKTPSKELQPQT